MTLTNASGSACSLAGWPAVRRLGRGGRVIPGRVFLYTYSDIASVPFHRVTLQPGHAASFNFFGPDYEIVANRSCPNTRKLEVKLPGAHGWLSIARKIPACAVLYVDPLVPGRTDRRWGGVGIQHFAHP